MAISLLIGLIWTLFFRWMDEQYQWSL